MFVCKRCSRSSLISASPLTHSGVRCSCNHARIQRATYQSDSFRHRLPAILIGRIRHGKNTNLPQDTNDPASQTVQRGKLQMPSHQRVHGKLLVREGNNADRRIRVYTATDQQRKCVSCSFHVSRGDKTTRGDGEKAIVSIGGNLPFLPAEYEVAITLASFAKVLTLIASMKDPRHEFSQSCY